LWKFLRTIICNGGIAERVHELDIRNWTLALVHGRSRLVLSAADLELIRNSIHKMGLQPIEISMLEAARNADPRPLIALLLINLRNLVTLYAHLPETDIFFTEVLRKAVESRPNKPLENCPPLQRLREAHIASAWKYREDLRAGDHYKLEFNHLWKPSEISSL
jgi:hypothetical protein